MSHSHKPKFYRKHISHILANSLKKYQQQKHGTPPPKKTLATLDRHTIQKVGLTHKPESTIPLINLVTNIKSPLGQTLTLLHMCYLISHIPTKQSKKLHL